RVLHLRDPRRPVGDTENPVEPPGPHRILLSRVLLALDRDALCLCALVRTGDPYGQHTGVIRRGDRIAGDVGGQLERPPERPVTDLAERPPVLLLRALVVALTTNDKLTLVDLDVDVLLDVYARQLDPHDCVVAILGDFGGWAEAGEHALLYPAVDVPGGPSPQCHLAHR